MTRSPRVAADCRVSTLDEHADVQVEAIRRAARERGWHLMRCRTRGTVRCTSDGMRRRSRPFGRERRHASETWPSDSRTFRLVAIVCSTSPSVSARTPSWSRRALRVVGPAASAVSTRSSTEWSTTQSLGGSPSSFTPMGAADGWCAMTGPGGIARDLAWEGGRSQKPKPS